MKRLGTCATMIVGVLLMLAGSGLPAEQEYQAAELFSITEENPAAQTLHLTVGAEAVLDLREGSAYRQVRLPMLASPPLELELERFTVLSPTARVYRGSEAVSPQPVTLFRGRVKGEPHSLAYLSVGESGLVSGFAFRPSAQPVWLATPPETQKAGTPIVTVTTGEAGGLPEFEEFCATEIDLDALGRSEMAPAGQFADAAGVRVAVIGVDSDKQFTDLFDGNAAAAETYAQQLIGAISTIYERDLNVKLLIGFLRTWPGGGEPFVASNLGGFRTYWNNNEDTTGLNVIHMLSGSRTTSYGGVAYVGGTCGSEFRYAINAYLNGSFPTNYNDPSLSKWDIIVTSHEMGHNFGTFHTHDIDQYDPLIDSCAQGFSSRGTIMSYCHVAPGYSLNLDTRFHQRVQATIVGQVVSAGCHWFDCNGNDIDDSADIANLTSLDANLDGIPDECQDCNDNDLLDPIETAGGVNDVNLNGIPDECETDCDQNGLPDEYETLSDLTADTNGNGVPDVCEPDCNNNGTADHTEIAADLSIDLNRNLIPDECEDCNGNGQPDWQDIERAGNIYILSENGYVREYLGESGVPIQDLGVGDLSTPLDMAIGSDRRLYVADNGEIIRIDPTDDSRLTIWNGLDFAANALTFGPDNNLYVGSTGIPFAIYRLNGLTGALIDTFVTTLVVQPIEIEFGPNGNLYVLGSNDAVYQFDGSTGALVGTTVSPGDGGLAAARDLAWLENENILITSNGTNQVLEYDSVGTPLGQWNDSLSLGDPWGLEIGPDSNVYIMRRGGSVRLLRMLKENGRYSRALVRNDNGLSNPTVVKFMPPSDFDCNRNFVPDSCDIVSGVLTDANADGQPDECVFASCCVGMTGNVDNDPDDVVNLTDVTVLVNHLFVTFEPLPCPAEANTSGDSEGTLSLTDLTVLINHLFVSFEPMADCQ